MCVCERESEDTDSEIESASKRVVLRTFGLYTTKIQTTSFLERLRLHTLVGTIPIHIDPAFSFYVKSILSSSFFQNRAEAT